MATFKYHSLKIKKLFNDILYPIPVTCAYVWWYVRVLQKKIFTKCIPKMSRKIL